jgi:uncharacterized protein
MEMKCAALTGISPTIIASITSGRPRTLELQSAHNIISLSDVSPGDAIFMSSTDWEDLSPGDAGILVEVLSLGINMRRMVEFLGPVVYEERERTSARIQVKYGCSSIIKSIESKGMGKPTLIEVVKSACYTAG